MFFFSGFSALSWELLWQVYSGLSLGVSAKSVAFTLATMLAGMSIGAVAGGAWLERRNLGGPAAARWLALVEIVIAVSGILLPLSFAAIAWADALIAHSSPVASWLLQPVWIAAVVGPATLAMGGSVPLMRVLGGDERSLVRLYAANTAGAVLGVLAQAFVLIPALGLRGAGGAAAIVNLGVAQAALRMRPAANRSGETPRGEAPLRDLHDASSLIAVATGVVTFVLEVAWFRSLKAAFLSTSDTIAVILAAFLVAIAAGSALAGRLSPTKQTIGRLAAVGALLVCASNLAIDRADLIDLAAASWWLSTLERVGVCVLLICAPVAIISAMLPLLFRQRVDAGSTGRLYGLNTLGCVLGSLGAAWWLLPWGGAYRAVLLGAGVLALVAVWALRSIATVGLTLILVGAWFAGSGVGRTRVQASELSRELRPIASTAGADATVSVAIDGAGNRQLIIDGFQTSGEAPEGHYMQWMGRLPVLLHPATSRALVICFGTGQTANAVRREGAAAVDIVELSPEVISFAPLFPSNEHVLEDPRVQAHVTDGRAWLRRTQEIYDVITLEPMEPHFAGTNDLYSVEFYEAAARRLSREGVVAQWVPLHLLQPSETASVIASFVAVFEDAALWIDPHDRTGILVGKKPGTRPILDGLASLDDARSRDLAAADIRGGFVLGGDALMRLAEMGTPITDDNQLLAYGTERRQLWRMGGHERTHQANLSVISKFAAGGRTLPALR
jgi:predicted membrane-bound spermidine synthase